MELLEGFPKEFLGGLKSNPWRKNEGIPKCQESFLNYFLMSSRQKSKGFSEKNVLQKSEKN